MKAQATFIRSILGFWLRLAVMLCASLPISASAQIGGAGWTPFTVRFKIQSPTNAPQSTRYFVTNNPLPMYHCLVYSNDGAFSVGNTTLPRTEQRFEPDYTSGEIQYQAMLMGSPTENSYCVFQIHTGDAQSTNFGSTTFMLFWFSSDGGSVHDYSGTELAKNIGNKWFQLNVDHNLVTHKIQVWINKQSVWTQQDNNAEDFYFKDGVYEQNHKPTLQMDTYVSNILMWTSSGIAPPPPPPRILRVNQSGSRVVVSGGNGVAGNSYNVLASTNLNSPRNAWIPIVTNVFDAKGNFVFTNTVIPGAPRTFYKLKLQ